MVPYPYILQYIFWRCPDSNRSLEHSNYGVDRLNSKTNGNILISVNTGKSHHNPIFTYPMLGTILTYRSQLIWWLLSMQQQKNYNRLQLYLSGLYYSGKDHPLPESIITFTQSKPSHPHIIYPISIFFLYIFLHYFYNYQILFPNIL